MDGLRYRQRGERREKQADRQETDHLRNLVKIDADK